MNDYNPSGKNGSGESNEEDILVADDDGEILTDGGVAKQPTFDDGLGFTASIETKATPQEVSVRVEHTEGIVKFGFLSETITGVFFLEEEQVDHLINELQAAKEQVHVDE